MDQPGQVGTSRSRSEAPANAASASLWRSNSAIRSSLVMETPPPAHHADDGRPTASPPCGGRTCAGTSSPRSRPCWRHPAPSVPVRRGVPWPSGSGSRRRYWRHVMPVAAGKARRKLRSETPTDRQMPAAVAVARLALVCSITARIRGSLVLGRHSGISCSSHSRTSPARAVKKESAPGSLRGRLIGQRSA